MSWTELGHIEIRKEVSQVARDTLSSEMVRPQEGSENSFTGVWPETEDGKEKSRSQAGAAAGSQV